MEKTEDIIYAGEEPRIAQAIQARFPNHSFRQITTSEEIMDYLKKKMFFYEMACMAGSMEGLLNIYPKVVLVAPDLQKSQTSKETTPIGPALVDNYRERVRSGRIYVLANDDAYESNRNGLKSCCETFGTPVIKESELEKKLEEILK